MRGLYAIVDSDFLSSRGVPLAEFAHAVLEGRPAVLQVRAKHAPARQTLEWLRLLRPACTRASVLLFANDRPDLALLAGCDGVHVGQTDLTVTEVRRFAPALRIGVSTHDGAQLEAALALRPDYVAYGPVYPTSSKEKPDPVTGLAALARASSLSRAASVPLVAIGGMDLARARDVHEHAPLAAVLSALLPDEGIAGVPGRVRELQSLLSGP